MNTTSGVSLRYVVQGESSTEPGSDGARCGQRNERIYCRELAVKCGVENVEARRSRLNLHLLVIARERVLRGPGGHAHEVHDVPQCVHDERDVGQNDELVRM